MNLSKEKEQAFNLDFFAASDKACGLAD